MKKTTFVLTIVIQSFTFLKAQNVNIPDNNFKNYLLARADINTNNDNEIQISEATAFTGTINCSSKNISDLTGIEKFTNLTELYCVDNFLTTLDLSYNLYLQRFSGEENQLTSLSFGNNVVLSDVFCNHNQLSTLNFSANSSLKFIECHNNNLTTLQVNNLNLLESLSCDNNLLTNLDVSQNYALRALYCNNNHLTNLDLSQNITLYSLYCANNYLTNLDLGFNPNLSFLDCFNNNLTSLNIKNGNNLNLGGGALMPAFFAYGNPNLFCIQVDNPIWAENTFRNGNHVDSWASFSSNCNLTVDNNFKNTTAIFPNPAKHTLNFKSNESIQKVNIYDMNGKIIKSDHPKNNNINISDLATGIYIVEIYHNKSKKDFRLIKN